jgi:hypothetical protein
MYVPGYTADASLYRSARMYRPSNSVELAQATTAESRLVLAQLTGGDCIAACLGVGGACAGACWWAGPGAPACLIACAAAAADCVASCPPDPSGGGNGSGPPPPPVCCPRGHCCGDCVDLPTGGQHCVGGPCVSPPRVCP